ncbi:TetR/AcrR family transcriptional regulator [Paenibacillus sp. UNC451MF]|uniref:TetR/AcrR family transcriptional regulator n=1 Tax=Paenibacillus sp. UNC451MF TaxID=1449063 RepID=UPI00048C3E20|nr:TetR/AcrR family transcriptional regulator [Paenibacillus sp. UNC451MF]
MEELKKQQIIHTAMGVFKEKGYFAASMKDIAEACGMAKGSIYKIFPSKEDLFTAVFVACHQTMFDQAKKLDQQGGLSSPKDKLQRKIEFQLQFMMENYYFTSEFKELPVKDNEQFIIAWKKKRVALLKMLRDCFHEAYGDTINDYIWDIVVIYRGLLKEYLSFTIQKAIALSMSELALFLVERMDTVVNGLITQKPTAVLKECNVYFNQLNPIDPATLKQMISEVLGSIETKINVLAVAAPVHKELLEVIGLLQKEFEQEVPNHTLLRVYASYLENNSELSPYIRQLQLMMER